ncbi:MAG: amidohydrolase family protein [Saprospiraceae bacterium]|nr:amidohydrolase family protein [Saprospiraceae bacterium]
MQRIDAHQHFWTYDPINYDWINADMAVLKKDFLPDDLLPHLQRTKMDGCVAVQARQELAENDFLLNLAQQYEEVMGVVGWVDLQCNLIEQTLTLYQSQPAFKGVRHIVQGEPDPEFMIKPDFIRGVKALGDANLTYDILVFAHQFPAVLTFLERCLDQPFVLDHLGKPNMKSGPSPDWIAGIHHMAEHPNVYCKVSGLVTEADWNHWTAGDFFPYLDVVFKAFGIKRIMVGSDWPVCLLAADDYISVLSILDEYTDGFDEGDKQAIYGGNAQCFYKL